MCKENNEKGSSKITVYERQNRLDCLFENFLKEGTLDDEESVALLKMLLELGAAPSKDVDTLLIAIKKGYIDIVKLSIEDGAKVDESFFIAALENDDINFANYLLDKVDKAGNSALNWISGLEKAITLNQIEIVKRFINLGIDINASDGLPLITAIRCCNEEIFDLLVSAGADVKINNNEPISVAVTDENNYKIVQKLIDLGVDVTACNNRALINCVHNISSNVEILDLLIKEGADLTSRNCEVLEYCVRNQKNRLVDVLLKTDMFSKEKVSSYLVYVCKTSFNYELVAILLDHGPSKAAINESLKYMRSYKKMLSGAQIYNELKRAK